MSLASPRARSTWARPLALLVATGLPLACSGPSDQAASWRVLVENPTGDCLTPGSVLRLDVAAFDDLGRAIDGPRYAVSAEPADALSTDDQGRRVVQGEGPLELTVSYSGAQSPHSQISPQVLHLMRDGTAPVLTLTAPARGELRQSASNDDALEIHGSAADALSPVKALAVNGERLDVSGENAAEPIEVTVPAHWGTNVLDVRAADACGNTARDVRSFLQSTAYLPPAVTKRLDARVANASVIRVAQAALDDSNRADFDDLMTIGERYLQNNLARLTNEALATIPTQSVDVLTCTFSADPISGATIGAGSPTLQLRLGQGDLTVSPVVTDVRIPVRYREVCRGLLGNVISDRSAVFGHVIQTLSSDVTVTPHVVANQLSLPVSSQTNVTGLSVDSSSNPTLAAAISAALGTSLSSAIEALIEPQLDQVLAFTVRSLLEGGLASLTAVVPIQLPPPFPPVVSVAGDWTSIAVSPSALTLELGEYFYPSSVGTPYAAGVGAISAPYPTRALTGLPGAPLTFGVGDDAVNLMLWAIWYGGGLELSDLQAYAAALPDFGWDLTGVTLDLSGLLPPVIAPGDEPERVVLGIGDVHVTGTVDLDLNATLAGTGTLRFDLFASLLSDGSSGFDVAHNVLDLRLGGLTSRLDVQVVSLQLDGAPLTDPEAIRAFTARLRELVQALVEGLARDLGAAVQLPQPRLDFPPSVFGPQSGFVLDLVSLQRDTDRFVASVDPDDLYAPVVLVGNWAQLSSAAAVAAREDAAAWLEGATVGCRIWQDIAFGRAVRRQAHLVTDHVKQALLAAGAPDAVAREWNRVFKAAWLGWGDRLEIPDLRWFPEFAGDDFVSGVPHQSPAVTGPIGSLESPGTAAMTPPVLLADLEFRLQDYLDQPGAPEALDAFASDVGGRFQDALATGTIDGVRGEAVYPDFALFVVVEGVAFALDGPEGALDVLTTLWPPPPPRGPLIGACLSGGTFGSAAFSLP